MNRSTTRRGSPGWLPVAALGLGLLATVLVARLVTAAQRWLTELGGPFAVLTEPRGGEKSAS